MTLQTVDQIRSELQLWMTQKAELESQISALEAVLKTVLFKSHPIEQLQHVQFPH